MLLALDTSFGAVSAALVVGDAGNGRGQRVAHRFEVCANGHAERFFDLLGEVLAETGAALADVRRVAVTLGPGTFTGVRTGVAIARALALAAGAEVVGTTSLALMAHTGWRLLAAEGGIAGGSDSIPGSSDVDRDLVVAVDARRQQIYLQRFRRGVASAGPALLAIDEAAATLDPVAVLAVGSGACLLAEAARQRGAAIATALGSLEPDARDLIALAPHLPPLATVRPLYIRPPDAKPPANPAVARRA